LAFNELAAFGLEEFVRRRRAPDSLWGFVHLPKAAGSSLLASLRQHFGPLWHYHPPDDLGSEPEARRWRWDLIRGFIAHQKQQSASERFRSFAGHIEYRQIEFIINELPDTKLFSIVRDPVERVVSNFRYFMSPTHELYQDFARTTPTIDSYISQKNSQNLMTKFLLGYNREFTERDAKELFDRYDFLGSVKYYEESLIVLSRLFGIETISPLRVNVTSSHSNNTVELNDILRERIRELNASDVNLYDCVNRVLESTLSANNEIGRISHDAHGVLNVTSGSAPGNASVGPIVILGPSLAGAASLLRLCQNVLGFGATLHGPDIATAPDVRKSAPGAKFIFVKQRGIESVASQLHRLPETTFETACSHWAEQMDAWLAIRGDLEESHIEIDERELDFYPSQTARRIQAFLDIGCKKDIDDFLRVQSARKATIGDGGAYVPLRDTDWDAARKQRFRDICGEPMNRFGYPLDGPRREGARGQLDLASEPLCGLWRVENGNPWIATQGPGLRLHPSVADPGSPPATLRFAGALGPGRYRFDGLIRVNDARCSRHRLVMSVSGESQRECGRLELDGARVGQVQWEIATIEVRERSDVVIEIILDESSSTANCSGTRLVSARFTPL